jgi:hypothetical protein
MNQPTSKPLDLAEYAENRRQFPPEELLKYAGQYVAFSLDGARILASGTTEEALERQLLAAGIEPSQVVGSYIPPSGVAILL